MTPGKKHQEVKQKLCKFAYKSDMKAQTFWNHRATSLRSQNRSIREKKFAYEGQVAEQLTIIRMQSRTFQ
jgi:hypothetical protein